MTQKEALDILKMGHNVFLTGAAGSGKTYLLNRYIDYLREHKISVGITASTGIAATHMGGTTIHSFTGMGIRDTMSEKEIAELFKRQYLRKRFLNTKVLIIDEISMLHAHRLDLVHAICKAFKKIDYPFGGMQIVMCGDFFQLPPVTNKSNYELGIKNYERDSGPSSEDRQAKMTSFWGAKAIPESRSESQSDFVYNSSVWKEMKLQVCYLDEQFRQDDRAFLRVLNDIRNHEVTEMTVEQLTERLNRDTTGYVRPTRLYTHNIDVDKINKEQLEALPGEVHEYMMSWRGSLGMTESLRKSCLAPEILQLKVGAQVMFVKNNYDEGYVNGTLGEVIGFDKNKAPVIRTFDGSEITATQASWEVKDPSAGSGQENSEEVLASITQLPLRLAWAITVHKSQGMSLDAAEIDLRRSFIPGMGYVALSRVRSLSGLRLLGMNHMALQINQDVLAMDREFRTSSDEAVVYLQGLDRVKKEKLQSDFFRFLKGG